MTKTYREEYYPGLMFAESSVKEVQSRDTNIELPRSCFMFKFYDIVSLEVDGEILNGNPKNFSPNYYPNAKLLTREDVEKEPDNKILLSNMEEDKYVIKCRTGNFQRWNETDVIL